jgi:ABC-type transport system involved in multi-copper enzyme maturation permease subunit
MNPLNAVLVASFLRQRLGSPMRLLILGFLFFSSFMIVLVTRQLGTLEGAPAMFALVLAAGAIGQEVSSGVLTLTFARPVTRAAYVLSRWAGAAGFAAALGLVQVAVGLMAVTARGGPVPGAADVAALAIECVLTASAAAAVMVMLSSLVNGLGDVALWALAAVSGGIANMAGSAKNWPALVRASAELDLTLTPKLHVGWLFGNGDPQVYALVAVLSTIPAALAVAVWVVNRKELSYAAG